MTVTLPVKIIEGSLRGKHRRIPSLCSAVLLEWLFPEDIIAYNKKRLMRSFSEQYQLSKYFPSHGRLPLVKHTSSWAVCRQEDVLISRLLCQMLITPALLYRFRLADYDQCTYCHTCDSLQHILLTCCRYQQQRQDCFGTDVSSLYFCSLSDFVNQFIQSSLFRASTLHFLLLIKRF